MNQENGMNLDNIFTYHKPFGTQPHRYALIRTMARGVAKELMQLCPDSRERSLALTSLQQMVMWANASIAVNEQPPVNESEA